MELKEIISQWKLRIRWRGLTTRYLIKTRVLKRRTINRYPLVLLQETGISKTYRNWKKELSLENFLEHFPVMIFGERKFWKLINKW